MPESRGKEGRGCRDACANEDAPVARRCGVSPPIALMQKFTRGLTRIQVRINIGGRRGGSSAGWSSSIPVDGMASAGGGMIFARALPEKAKVTETYEVDQVISVNPRRTQGKQHTGRIEITVPYDGQRYFTRQAAR